MAPRGKSSAHRLAAARQKWKVGDLVLAKVKGFPAWPAKVGDPEKWGHSADSKKVVVCFFGGEQIAFCNPADIEEFTEEKKVSLLGRRHGKGADFGRAVNEIIECFEKLKKQDEDGKADGSEESSIPNGRQSTTTSAKDEAEAPFSTAEAHETEASNDVYCPSELEMAAPAELPMHDDEKKFLEASSGVAFIEPLSNSGSRRNKSKFSQVNGSSENRKSTLRSRSTSCADTEGLGGTYSRRARSSGANVCQDRHLRRSSRIMKLSDDSEGQAADLNDSVSEDGNEESGSEIMSLEIDTGSIDDGKTSDVHAKPLVTKILAETSVLETESSNRLDFQGETAIIKKKRMHSRKRQGNDNTTLKVGNACPDGEVVNSFNVSSSFSENVSQISVREDGDEHLPLVKRARARMGRSSPSSLGEGLVTNKSEVSKDPGPFVHCDDNIVKSLAVVEPLSIKDDQPKSSLSSVNVDEKSHHWDIKKNSIYGEATLPPSKRIHRALEAMSANAADDCEGCLHDASAVIAHSNGYCASVKDCSELVPAKDLVEMASKAERDVGSHVSGLCVGNVDGDTKMIAATLTCQTGVECTNNEYPRESSECVKTEVTSLEVSVVDDLVTEMEVELHEKVGSVMAGDELATGPNISPADHCKIGSPNLDIIEAKIDPGVLQVDSHSNNEEDIAETISVENLDPAILQMNSSHSNSVEEIVGAPSEIKIATPINDADCKADDQCNTTDLPMENKQESKRSVAVEVNLPSLDSDAILTHVGLPDGLDQSLLPSVSGEYTDHRNISVTQPSSLASDGRNPSSSESPTCSSKDNLCVINNLSLDNNISESPCSHIHPEKFNSENKSSSRENSLLAFESMVGSLTRTKDSIGRATRLAIDAAKFGLAPKVVEILVCVLERESSLHKKVNLFFLIDSITQSSRAMKGDGGIYLSSVQAMLPRLLSAAVPPGSSSNENHRQCLKVLKVWLERKILPEPIIRHHIRELEAFCFPYPAVGSRRPQRNERAFDDPVRQMEGMLVDEYGSNSSIQLPGFCMPPMQCDNDGRNDSDGENCESIWHSVDTQDAERTPIPTIERRPCILEDVEGELEMEDVAPFCESVATLPDTSGTDSTQLSHPPSNNNNETLRIPLQEDAQLASAPFSRCPPQQPPPLPHPSSPPGFPPVAPPDDLDSKRFLNSQNSNREFRESTCNQSDQPRVRSTMDAAHHRHQGNGYFEDQVPRKLPDSNSACPVNRPNSHFSGRDFQRSEPYGKGFHWRPPQPGASSQFSYGHEREQSRRDNPPPHYNRYRSRNPENGNFYRHRDRNKFGYRDHSADYWRPPYPYNSGPCYQDNGRMNHPPPSYGGPPREPPFPNNRWNCPPGPVNHRHVNHYNHCEGPIPVENRASDYWRPR